MIRPPSLKKNDKAIILSPAGKVDRHIVSNAAIVLEGWGLKVDIGEHALGDKGRFSGTITDRLNDLQNALDDSEVKLILCSRGGYGVVHLLHKLNFSTFKETPKWVIGYSDITALHVFLQYHGVSSIHGPMASHFAEEGAEDASVQYTKSILAGQSVSYDIPLSYDASYNRKGSGRGRLFGGNLSVFTALFGSKQTAIPKGGILFIEDTGEVPYKIDRMMYQLKFAGIFNNINGLIVGKFNDYEEDDGMYSPLRESIFSIVEEYDFPVCFDFPVGHTRLNYPLIIGADTEFNVNDQNILFKQ